MNIAEEIKLKEDFINAGFSEENANRVVFSVIRNEVDRRDFNLFTSEIKNILLENKLETQSTLAEFKNILLESKLENQTALAEAKKENQLAFTEFRKEINEIKMEIKEVKGTLHLHNWMFGTCVVISIAILTLVIPIALSLIKR